MLKEKIKEADEAQHLRQCKWINITFSKDGRKATGLKSYDSIKEAEIAVQKFLEIESEIKARGAQQRVKCREGNLERFWYAWHMQTPEIV